MIFRILLWQKTLISISYPLLYQQSVINYQEYKDVGKFNKRSFTSIQITIISHHMVSSSGISKKYHYIILSKSWRKCKEEQPFKLWELFVLLCYEKLRLSLALFLFISILTKLAVGIILKYHCSPNNILLLLS